MLLWLESALWLNMVLVEHYWAGPMKNIYSEIQVRTTRWWSSPAIWDWLLQWLQEKCLAPEQIQWKYIGTELRWEWSVGGWLHRNYLLCGPPTQGSWVSAQQYLPHQKNPGILRDHQKSKSSPLQRVHWTKLPGVNPERKCPILYNLVLGEQGSWESLQPSWVPKLSNWQLGKQHRRRKAQLSYRLAVPKGCTTQENVNESADWH